MPGSGSFELSVVHKGLLVTWFVCAVRFKFKRTNHDVTKDLTGQDIQDSHALVYDHQMIIS